jgi:hypothetical protein
MGPYRGRANRLFRKAHHKAAGRRGATFRKAHHKAAGRRGAAMLSSLRKPPPWVVFAPRSSSPSDRLPLDTGHVGRINHCA